MTFVAYFLIRTDMPLKIRAFVRAFIKAFIKRGKDFIINV
jgi:hypothetical protein